MSSVPSSSSSMQSSLSSGLPRSTIAAIVSACVLGFLFTVGVIAYVLWTRKKRRQWWKESGEMRFSSGRNVTSGPRHRRVRSAEMVDVLNVHPGQGLSIPNPVGVGYDYRDIAGDEGILEIGPVADGDSDSGHSDEPGHKKSVSIPSFDNLPRERATSASPTTGRSSRYRRSLNLGRWSGWFGSQHRSSVQSTVDRDSFIPDISIVAPIPTRAMRPVSLLARAHVRDSQSRRSSSAAHLETGEAFLDLRRTSPFEVDFVKGSSGTQPQVRHSFYWLLSRSTYRCMEAIGRECKCVSTFSEPRCISIFLGCSFLSCVFHTRLDSIKKAAFCFQQILLTER